MKKFIFIVIIILTILFLLLAFSKLQQHPFAIKKTVINGDRHQNYQQCLSENPIDRDNCYIQSAIANSDLSICSNIQDTSTTKYLINNCILISEAVNSSVLPLICKGLDENSCNGQVGCRAGYISSACEGCTEKSYYGCDINDDYFCTKSGGIIDEKNGECACSEGKTLIKPYGCFDCEKFSNSIAKAECVAIKMASGDKVNIDKVKDDILKKEIEHERNLL